MSVKSAIHTVPVRSPTLKTIQLLGRDVFRLELVLVGPPAFGQRHLLEQTDVMPIGLADVSRQQQAARGIGPGAEPDRVGCALLEIVERLLELDMPIGAIDGGDIDPVDVRLR